jgi:preprotein translocase subunit SecE
VSQPRRGATGLAAVANVDEPARRRSILKPRWVMDIISELRKVTWPTRQETAHLTLVVIVVSLLFGAFLGSADLAFSWVVERILFN